MICMYPGLVRHYQIQQAKQETEVEEIENAEDAEEETSEDEVGENGETEEIEETDVQESAEGTEQQELIVDPKPPTKAEILHERLIKAESVSQTLENTQVNIFSAVAETFLFLSILLLKQATSISKPERVSKGIKFALILGFVVLYPLYGILSLLVMGSTYYYLRFFRM